MEKRERGGYPSDVSDEEWSFVAPYLALCKEESAQRDYPLRAVFNGLRYIVRTGAQWRYMPNDLPPWYVVYQQTQRWIRARCFETMVEDLRMLLREFSGRKEQPTAMIADSRTLQSTPESGARAGYDGAKRRKGSKVHAAVDTLGHLLALHVTPADEQDRAQVGELAGQVQQITGESVTLAYVDQGYTGEAAQEAAAEHSIQLQVSSTPRPNVVLSCCREDGWWKEALPGPPASAASHETTSAWLPPWAHSTSWPTHASCSQASSECSPEVNNRL
jgi:transposase